MAVPAWTRPGLLRAWLLGTTALLPAATGALAQGVAPNTLPIGGQVSAGAASIAQSGSAMQVTQSSNRAAINWQGFSVGANASVNFQQPSAAAWTLNRVTGADPSVIAGRITANGGVALVNQSGVVFAAGAQVNVGSLIASAANITNENFMAGRLVFDGPPRPGATVENHGSITIADRGLAALVGPRVANSGTIRARLGRVALAGAETFSIDLAGDGLLSIDVTQAVRTAAGGGAALVTNSGVIEAHGGSVLLSAHAASGLVEDLVRNTGSIAANTTAGRTGQVALRAEGGGVRVEGSISATGRGRQAGGSIEVRGSTSTTIAATARLDAPGGAGGGRVLVGTTGVGRDQAMGATTTVERGARISADARRRGNGGTVAINSNSSTVVNGSVSARGGRRGGNGGLIELSGQDRLALQAQVDLSAPKGKAGTLLLDPQNITVVTALPGDPVADGGAGSTTATPDGANTVSASAGTGTTFVTAGSLNSLDGAGVTVQLEAKQNIAVNAALSLANSTLNLFADGAITQTATITAGTLVIRGFAGGSSAAGSATLNLANTIGTLDAIATGVLSVNNGTTGLIVTNAQGSAVTLTTTGTLGLAGAVGGSGATVVLQTDGAITQTGGSITAASLVVSNSTGTGATAGTVNLGQTNAVNAVDIRATGAVTVNNGSNALLLTRATGSSIAIIAGALTVPGAATVQAPGGTISLRVDSLAWGGLLDAGTTGTLEIGPRSNAATVSLGAGGAGSLQIDPGSFDATRLIAGTFAVGETTIGASTVRGNGLTVAGAVAPDAAAVATALRLVADAGTAISIEAPVDMAGRAVALLGSGAIGQTAAGKITAATLDVAAPGGGAAGAVSLNAVANAIGRASIASSGTVLLRNDATPLTLGGLSGTGATITTAGTLTIDGAIGLGAGTLNLFSDGAIGQTGGVVTAGSLVVRDASGAAATTQAVALDGADNAIAAIDIASTGSVAVKNGATDLAVTALSASGATLTTGGALSFAGAANLGAGTLTLRAGGAVTQANTAVITAGTLVTRNAAGGTASASVTLDTASNAIDSLDGATTAAYALKTTTALTVTGLLAQSAMLTSATGIAIAGAVTVTDGLALNAPIMSATAVVTAASLTLRGADGIAAASGALNFDATEHAIGALDAKSDTAIRLRNGMTDLVVNQAVAPIVLLEGRGALSIAGLVDATGGTGITLRFDGAVSATGAASLRGPALSILGFGGGDAASIDLALGTHVLDTYAGQASGLNRLSQAGDLLVLAATGSTVDIASTGGALTLGGAIGGTGAAVTLSAQGDLTQPAGSITAATLSASSATGKLDLQQANAVASAGLAAATTLDFASASALTVTGAAGTIVSLTAPSLSLTGAVGGTTRVQLTTTAGGIGQSGAGLITTPDLRLTVAGGDAALTLANAVDQFRASAAGRLVSFTSVRDLTLAGGISGTTVSIIGKSILVDASQNPSVALSLTTTDGSITQTAGATLRATTMDFSATGGDILLGSGDHVATNASFTAPGRAVAYTQIDDPLTLTGASAATVAITAPSVALTGAVAATTSLALTTTAGGISQTVAGAITTPRLAAIATGGAVLLDAADDVATGNAIGQLGASSSSGGVSVVSRTAMEVHAAGIGVTAAAGGTIALEAPSLTINQALGFAAAAAGNRITLTADALTATAAINAGATGQVAIRPRAATRGIDLGGATANMLQLGAATLGQVTAGRLLISAAGATGIGLNADLVLGGVGILDLVAGTGIAQDHATGLTVAALAATAASGSIDLGGANQIGAIAGSLADPTTGLSATVGITLVTAGALSVGAKVQAGNAQTIAITAGDLTTSAGIATTGSSVANRIDLRADTVVLGADVTATGGTINILPRTSGRAVRLGGADGVLANTLYLPSSQFRFIQAGSGMLRIGGTDSLTTAGTITLGGEVPLRASLSGGAVVGGSAATLDLRGAVLETDAGVTFGLNVGNLTGTTGGAFELGGFGNAIDTLGAISGVGVVVLSDLALTAAGTIDGGGGLVVLGSGGGLTLAGDVQGQFLVMLRSDGVILQTGGRIVGDMVQLGGYGAQATSATLQQPDNDFGSLIGTVAGPIQAFSTAATAGSLTLSNLSGTSIAVTSGKDLGVGGSVTTTAGTLTLGATGTISLGGSLAATGDITLVANAAAGVSAITQTAGSVRSSGAGTIGLTADTISLLAAPNSVGTSGLVMLRPLTDGRAITLGATVANTLSLVSGAGIAAGRVLIGRAEAGPITLGGSFGVGTATLELITGGAIGQAGGTVLTAGALSATAGGGIILDGQNLIDAVAGSTADPSKGLTSGGSIALTTARAGGLTTSAAITAANGATITLRADALTLGGTVGASSGSLAALNILPNTAGTAVTLGAEAAGLALGGDEIGFLRAGTGTLRIGGDGSSVTAGAITLAGDVLLRGGTASAEVLDLRGDSVAQTGGRVAVATLTGASTAGGFALNRLAAGAPVNQIDSLGLGGAGNPVAISATGGAVAIASANALRVRGNVTAAAAAGSGTAGVSLRGNGLTIGDETALAKTVLVQAGRGDLVLDAGGGMLTTSAVTTLRAQDPASLAAEGTGADLFGNILLSGGTVTLAGTLDASRASGGRDIILTSTAALELGNVSLAARRDLSLASTAGGVTVQAAATLVAGRDLGLAGLGAMQVAGTLTANRSIGITSSGSTVSLTGSATAAASGPVLADAGAGLTISGLGDVTLDGSLTATGRSILAATTSGTLTVGGTLSTATGGSITLNATGSTGRTIIAAPGAVSGGTVTINAAHQIQNLGSIGGSDITLTVGPSGSPSSPAFEAGSGSSLIASGALAITANSGNIGLTAATLQAGTTLALTAAAGSITQTQGSTSAGGAVTLQAATGITVTAAGGTAPVLRSTGASLSLATSGGDIALTDATLAAASSLSVTAAAGSITQTRGSTLAAGSLIWQAATGIGVTNGGGTAPQVGSTGSSLAFTTTAGDLLLTEASIGAGTSLGLTATAGDLIQSGGSLTAGTTLSLTSGGDTTQLAGGRIIAPVLTGAAGGSVTLLNGATLPGALVAKASGNSIGAIAGYTAGGDFSLASNATPLGITGLVSAGAGRALRLFADDYALTAGLAAPGGSVTLSPYTRDGSIALVLGGSTGASAADTITLDSAELALLPPGGIGTLRFGTADNPAGLTDLASVTIAGAADLGTRVSLLELDTRGAITQNAGTSLIVPLLTATAGDSISLDPGSSANRIGGLAGIRTPGNFALRTALVAGAAMTIGAGSFADGIRVGSGRSITLRADDLDIAAALRAPGGTITLMTDTAGRGITLGGAGAGTLSLSAAELQLLGGEGGGGLDSGAATVLRIDATTVPGDIAIAGTVDLQGPAARFQALELLSAGNVAGSGGAITVPVLRAAVAGNLVLDHAGNRFLLNRITAANATIRQAGDLRLANAVAALGGVDAPGGISAAGTVRLIAGGSITQEGGATITAGTLALSAGVPVTLEEANAFDTLADVTILGGGASRIRAANYTIAGPVTVTGGLTLRADTGLGATGSIATGGALALQTTLGDIVLDGATLTAGGGLTMTAGSSAASGGDILVTGGSIGVTGAAVLTATRDGTPGNPGDIGLDGTTITASTDLTLAAGGGITAGSSTLTATGGAFAATAATGSIGLTGTTAAGGTSATLTAATGLTVTGGGVVANGGALTVTTTTGDLALDGASLSATGTLDLAASAGAIRQRRGSTSGGGRTRLLAQTGIIVTADGGTAPLLRSIGERLIVDTATGAIALTGVTAAAGTEAMISGEAVSITGGSLVAGAGAQVTAFAGTIALSGTSLTAATDLALQASLGITGDATILAATGGTLGATTAAGDIGFTTVIATAGGNLGLLATAGAVTLTGSSATAGGGATLLGGTGVSLASSGVTADGGALAVTTTAGDIGLVGSSLTGNGAGGTVTLLAGTDSAQGGDITIAGSTLAGRSLTVQATTGSGGANAGDLTVTDSALTGALATGLQAGGSLTVTGGSVTATAGVLTAAAVTGAATFDSTALSGQGIGLGAGGLMTLRRGAATSGAGLGISGGSGVILTADGGAAPVITAGTLTVTTGGGDIRLTGAEVQAGATEFRAGTGGVLGGDIGVAGGSLTAGQLTLTAIAGSGHAGTIGLGGTAITAGGGATLTAAGGMAASATTLAVTGALAATTAAGGIGLDTSIVTATGALGLTATTGAITQRRGTTSGGGAVTLQAGRGITVTADGGAAPVLRSTGASLAATTTAGDLMLTGATLSAATGLGLTATAGSVAIGTSTALAGTDATLAAGTGIAASGSNVTAGTMTVTATGGGITLAGTTLAAAGDQALRAGGAIGLTGSTLTAGGRQSVTAGGTLGATGSSLTATGNQALAAGTGLTLTDTRVTTRGSLTATTSLGAAAVTDATLAAAGSLSLTATAGAVTQTRGSVTGGGDTRLRGGTGVTVTDAGSGTAPILRSTGGSLGLLAEAGNVTLANARLDAASGIGIAAGGGIGATDSRLATAGGTLSLAATGGDLMLLRGTLASTAGDLDLTAGGAGTLTATSLAAASPSGRVRVVTGGPLTLRNLSVTADVADFEAGRLFPANPAAYGQTRPGGVLVNDGITATIGTKLLFAGPGGITDLGLTMVLPRGAALPAVIYDTRLNPTTNPLGQVQPDVAGVPAAQQATQVRSAPGALSPGAFGLPDQSSAAGAVAMNINAGQSAVFLLVDGGAIQGNIVAGRLGVHGAGGGMSLFGTLDGSQGAQAARFADITRPIAATELQRYRINGCVISSVNCVVPPSIQIIPPRPTDRAAFRIENNRINTSEVLIPNIAEEDDDE